MAYFGPEWWHHHGRKVKIESLDWMKNIQLILSSHAARLIIVQCSDQKDQWLLTWEIRQVPPAKSFGLVCMTSEQLQRAFGLLHGTSPTSTWLLDRYGGTCAEQGKFIRKGDYLNIPGPGTGNDGDPNFSLELD